MSELDGWISCPRCQARCQARLEHDHGKVTCPACGLVVYAKPAPAVCALVIDDHGRILLGRRAREPEAGKWDIPGGFMDEFEQPLDTLRRELVRRDAQPRVPHRELQPLHPRRARPPVRRRGRRLHADDHLAALGELDRIADKVDDDLPQPARISQDRIGHELRAMYAELGRQPVPQRLLDLVGKLADPKD